MEQLTSDTEAAINAAEIDEPHEDVILGLNDELTDKG